MTGAESTETVIQETIDTYIKHTDYLAQYIQSKMPDMIAFGMKVLISVLILLIGSKIIQHLIKILKKSLTVAKMEPGVITFICSLAKYIMFALLCFLVLSEFGLTAGSVVALLGSCGLTAGLALQGSLSNFAGGVLILILKPFVVGDYIVDQTSGIEGTVKTITIYYTTLATPDNRVVMAPNGTLSNSTITNVSRMDKRRIELNVSVAYTADLKKAKSILEELISGQSYLVDPENTLVVVDQLGESSVVIGVKFWVKSADYLTAKWDMTEKIKLTLDQNQIEIPFNQMDVHIVGERTGQA